MKHFILLLILSLALSSCMRKDHLMQAKESYQSCYVKEVWRNHSEQTFHVWCGECIRRPTHIIYDISGSNRSIRKQLLRAKSRNRECYIKRIKDDVIGLWCDLPALEECFNGKPHKILRYYKE